MTLGERIRQFRTAHGLSQGDFAEQMDVSRQSVSKWENDLAVPELDKLIRMSTLFGVTLDTLACGEEEPHKTTAENTSGTAVADACSARSAVQFCEISGVRKIVGTILLCTAALLFVILSLLGGIWTGLILSLPFALSGVYCLIIRRYLALWIGWTLVLFVDVFFQFATSASRGVFWNFIRQPAYREMIGLTPQLILSFILNLLVLGMVLVTLFAFREFAPELVRKNILRTVFVFGGRIFLWGVSLFNGRVLLPRAVQISEGAASSVWLQTVFQIAYWLDLAALAVDVILLVLVFGLLRSFFASRRAVSGQ